MQKIIFESRIFFVTRLIFDNDIECFRNCQIDRTWLGFEDVKGRLLIKLIN